MSSNTQEKNSRWRYDGKFIPQAQHAFDKVMDFGDVSEAAVDAKGTTEYANRAIALGLTLALGLLGLEGVLMSKGVQMPYAVPLVTSFTSLALPWVAAKIGEKRSGVTDFVNNRLRRSQPEEPV